MTTLLRSRPAALLLAALAAPATAQVQALTLGEMLHVADRAVHGQIVAARSFRVDCPRDGDLYFTTLTIQGLTLHDARPLTVDVTFYGGFVSATEGVFNSEAPSGDDVKVGRNVVAFYEWSDDMGGGTPGNALVAGHGGIYRVVEGARGTVVMGRGEGYAVPRNLRVEQLESAVRLLAPRAERVPESPR